MRGKRELCNVENAAQIKTKRTPSRMGVDPKKKKNSYREQMEQT